MREAGVPSTGDVVVEVCPCTGGTHVGTTGDLAQRTGGKGYVKILLRPASGRGNASFQAHPPPLSDHFVHTSDHPTALCARIQSGIGCYIASTRHTLPEALFVKGGRSCTTPQGVRSRLHKAEAQVRKGRGRT
jgi:hypothetical protein